jgi:nucleoside-diphosphate-sugar epimerase
LRWTPRISEKSEVGLLLANNAHATELLGWTPQVSLEQGLAEVVEWVRENLHTYRTDEYAV